MLIYLVTLVAKLCTVLSTYRLIFNDARLNICFWFRSISAKKITFGRTFSIGQISTEGLAKAKVSDTENAETLH